MAYTKEELLSALTEAIGGTAKGKEIIEKAAAIYDEHGKYSQDLHDRLDESLNAYKQLIKRDDANDRHSLAAEDAEKMAIVEKALDVLKQLNS